MAKTIIEFARSLGDVIQILSTERPGRIDGYYVGKDSIPLYLVAFNGDDGFSADPIWLRDFQIGDPPAPPVT